MIEHGCNGVQLVDAVREYQAHLEAMYPDEAAPRADADTAGADPRILAEEWQTSFVNKCGYPPDSEDGYAAGYRAALLAAGESNERADAAPAEVDSILSKMKPPRLLNDDGTLDKSAERADAEQRRDSDGALSKDAVLTDDQIREIWLRETGFDEQAAPFAIIEFARAILAAKEKKS